MMDATNLPFPCVFGVKGWKRNQLRFTFGDESDTDATGLATALREYLAIARSIGPYTSLVVTYAPTDNLRTFDEYAGRFWTILQDLHNADRSPWPSDIPRSTADPRWDFCFGGEPVFVPASLPCYVNRRSRSSYSFGMMFQPRWVFDLLISDVRRLERARALIRARADRHDVVPVHPAIGVYGDPSNLEWRQYLLPDDNDTVLSRCPLMLDREKTSDGPPLSFVPFE
jgi:hypothetical protein